MLKYLLYNNIIAHALNPYSQTAANTQQASTTSKNPPSFKEIVVDNHDLCRVVKDNHTYHIIPNQPITDFFSAPEQIQVQLLKSLWDTQMRLEKESPAAGYQVHITGDRSGNSPFSMQLHAIGSRPKGSQPDVQPPARINDVCQCVFCDAKRTHKDEKDLTKLCEEYDCFVIKSKYGRKPLIIPNTTPVLHWFDAPAEKLQLPLMKAAGKVHEVLQQQTGNSKYSIWMHVFGGPGAQTIFHLHVHVWTG